MMLKEFVQEKGFISAFFLIFLVTLGLMGAGGYVLVSSEAKNTTNEFLVLQADYAANGVAYYGISRIFSGFQNGTESFSIGGSEVDMNVVQTVNTTGDSVTRLTVTANEESVEREISIDILCRGLEDMAVVTEGTLDAKIKVYDEDENVDPDLIVTNVDSIPDIDTLSLHDIAIAQNTPSDPHIFNGDVTINGNNVIPEGQSSFWYNGDPANGPNVTWIRGNLISTGQGTLYGIVVVLGTGSGYTIDLRGNAAVNGVILCPDEDSSILRGSSGDKINGGIVTRGDIDGSGQPIIQYNHEYMGSFADYDTGDYRLDKVLHWKFQ